MLPSGFALFYYILDVQLFIQPQLVPYRETIGSTFKSSVPQFPKDHCFLRVSGFRSFLLVRVYADRDENGALVED